MSSPSPFSGRNDKVQIRPSGSNFAPKFDANGMIPTMAIDAHTREPLMFAYMNEQSLRITLECGEAVYWSRSRSEIWHKGKTSGNTQKIVEIRTDCDQDILILLVDQTLSPSLQSDPITFSEASGSKRISSSQRCRTIGFLGLQMKISNLKLLLTCCTVGLAIAIFLNISANPKSLKLSKSLIDLSHRPQSQSNIEYPANSGARAYQTWMMSCLDAHQTDLPKLTASAERAAELFVAKNATLTLAGDEGFISEASGRAGGLMSIGQWGGETGPQMIILYALRHTKLTEDIERIKTATTTGSMVVLFAPEADLAAARAAGLNGLAEVCTHAAPNRGLFKGEDGVWSVTTDPVALMIAEWIWLGEFIAACTRHGQMPAIWKSLGAEGGEAWAAKYRGKRYHDHFPSAVAPGVAGSHFIRELGLVLNALYTQERSNLLELANWTLQAKKEGKNAHTFVVGHCIRHHIGIPGDPLHFRLISKDWFYQDPSVSINAGDVILCIGQGGLPVEWGGFSKQDLPGKWRSEGAKIAWSFGNLRNSEFSRHKAMIPQNEIFIDQHFTLGDGLVEIPGFEIRILPASGITSEAVFWLATAEVQARLTSLADTSEPSLASSLATANNLADKHKQSQMTHASIGVPYAFDFKIDPTAAGWTVDGADKLLSPKIKYAPAEHQFYRLTFESHAKRKSNYSIHFQNALGEEIESDDYASFYPSDNWTHNEVYFRGREGGLTFQLGFHVEDEIRVRNVTVEKANISDVAKWSDKIFSTLPSINFTPNKEIGKRIPISLTKLRNNQRLRVVMLGDSIVNDSYNSHWDALVSRVFKGANLEVIASVRGSTGCQYYQNEANFKRYITDRKPELLMIGGISHGSDLAALREVISKTRVALPNCEILLMSGPVGKDFRPHDVNAPEALIPACSPIVDSFAAEQEKLAIELGIEYWDLATAWSHYLASSGKPFEWFHRDYIHANNRGKQVIARILESNFMECAQ